MSTPDDVLKKLLELKRKTGAYFRTLGDASTVTADDIRTDKIHDIVFAENTPQWSLCNNLKEKLCVSSLTQQDVDKADAIIGKIKDEFPADTNANVIKIVLFDYCLRIMEDISYLAAKARKDGDLQLEETIPGLETRFNGLVGEMANVVDVKRKRGFASEFQTLLSQTEAGMHIAWESLRQSLKNLLDKAVVSCFSSVL